MPISTFHGNFGERDLSTRSSKYARQQYVMANTSKMSNMSHLNKDKTRQAYKSRNLPHEVPVQGNAKIMNPAIVRRSPVSSLRKSPLMETSRKANPRQAY